MDMGGAIRSGIGALKAALESNGTILVVSSDMRTGLPTSADESQGGDGAAAAARRGRRRRRGVPRRRVGDARVPRALAHAGRRRDRRRGRTASASRCTRRSPSRRGTPRSRPRTSPTSTSCASPACTRDRSARVSKRLGVANTIDLSQTVGDTGTAHAMLLLASALETAQPGQVVALVVARRRRRRPAVPRESNSDTEAHAWTRQIAQAARRSRTRASSRGAGWSRPSRRTVRSRARVSAPAAERGARLEVRVRRRRTSARRHARDDRHVHRRPPRVLAVAADRVRDRRLRRRRTTSRSSSPTSMPDALKVGDRVEMTFRKLSTADGIHNYFWKARPVR